MTYWSTERTSSVTVTSKWMSLDTATNAWWSKTKYTSSGDLTLNSDQLLQSNCWTLVKSYKLKLNHSRSRSRRIKAIEKEKEKENRVRSVSIWPSWTLAATPFLASKMKDWSTWSEGKQIRLNSRWRLTTSAWTRGLSLNSTSSLDCTISAWSLALQPTPPSSSSLGVKTPTTTKSARRCRRWI